jgi:AcrR family transcriptional regulator
MSPRADAVRNRAKILSAATAVFAAHGVAASTEQVAAEAGVAIGTVFRHFPTKDDLLTAIMKDLLASLTARLEDPDTDLFSFFTELVGAAAEKRAVIELLPGIGVDEAILRFRLEVAALLNRAQAAGAVRAGIRADEVMALLVGACQGALHAGWSADLQSRTLAIIFAGLRPTPSLPEPRDR